MNRLLIALAVLTVVAVFVSYCALIAGARADRRSEGFEGGAAAPSMSGRAPLRAVGGSASASPGEVAPPSARRVPPDGSAA